MKRGLWLALVKFFFTLVMAFAVYAQGLENLEDPNWFERAALIFQESALTSALIAAVALAVVEVGEKVAGGFAYRRSVVKACLDRLVDQCEGRPRHNRLTVFRVVYGPRAFFHSVLSLRWTWWSRRKRHKWKRLFEIDWTEKYLVVYERSSGARNQRSAVAFRVSDRKQDCEGVAGLTWEEDFLTKENLPSVTRRDVKAVTEFEAINRMRKQNAIRQYVERTNIKSLSMLRSIDTYSKHFMGQVIYRPGSGRRWGVLLLDSEEEVSPFPSQEGLPPGGLVGKQFQACAETLAHLVR